jgi:hypothetical protein
MGMCRAQQAHARRRISARPAGWRAARAWRCRAPDGCHSGRTDLGAVRLHDDGHGARAQLVVVPAEVATARPEAALSHATPRRRTGRRRARLTPRDRSAVATGCNAVTTRLCRGCNAVATGSVGGCNGVQHAEGSDRAGRSTIGLGCAIGAAGFAHGARDVLGALLLGADLGVEQGVDGLGVRVCEEVVPFGVRAWCARASARGARVRTFVCVCAWKGGGGGGGGEGRAAVQNRGGLTS